MERTMKKLWEKLSGENGKKYVLILLIFGVLLMLLPAGTDRDTDTEETEEARLSAFLSEITEVGEVRILLSDKGAAVVCQGASKASVALDVTEAVCCYTGLGADRVKLFLMK